MNYPNKTFVLDTNYRDCFNNRIKHIVIIVASSEEIASKYLKDQLNFKGNPNDLVWLMDCNHPTIYDLSGNKPLEIQAKIMYNTSIRLEN